MSLPTTSTTSSHICTSHSHHSDSSGRSRLNFHLKIDLNRTATNLSYKAHEARYKAHLAHVHARQLMHTARDSYDEAKAGVESRLWHMRREFRRGNGLSDEQKLLVQLPAEAKAIYKQLRDDTQEEAWALEGYLAAIEKHSKTGCLVEGCPHHEANTVKKVIAYLSNDAEIVGRGMLDFVVMWKDVLRWFCTGRMPDEPLGDFSWEKCLSLFKHDDMNPCPLPTLQLGTEEQLRVKAWVEELEKPDPMESFLVQRKSVATNQDRWAAAKDSVIARDRSVLSRTVSVDVCQHVEKVTGMSDIEEQLRAKASAEELEEPNPMENLSIPRKPVATDQDRWAAAKERVDARSRTVPDDMISADRAVRLSGDAFVAPPTRGGRVVGGRRSQGVPERSISDDKDANGVIWAAKKSVEDDIVEEWDYATLRKNPARREYAYVDMTSRTHSTYGEICHAAD